MSSNTDRTIVLKWAPVLVGDVAGYVVLRAPDPEGPFEPIGRTSSRFGTIHSDSGSETGALGDGQAYSYRVHAFDGAGRVAKAHALVDARTEDPPTPPEGLGVKECPKTSRPIQGTRAGWRPLPHHQEVRTFRTLTQRCTHTLLNVHTDA